MRISEVPLSRLCLLVLLTLLTATAQGSDPPPVPREFRAAWVATVDNIDWPSRPGLSTAEQQRELQTILDTAVDLRLNCLIVQIRTCADALYPSTLEPWSRYLTGAQGQPPAPLYDPLTMWIEEAHRRGIELHAWFNPYRARRERTDISAPNHISQTQPDIVREYGAQLWLDPGEPRAAAHTLAVVRDVLQRYDIDGIHIDDYFYPYPIQQQGRDVPFPDDAAWQRYQSSGGQLSRDDWRRDNVNRLIQDIQQTVRELRPQTRFGISPFGIGRPNTAPQIVGFDQYEKLYADAALWLREGWCDYFAPQLYWKIAPPQQSFPVLYDYWLSENGQSRNVWPGLFTSRVGDRSRPFPPTEITEQIRITRSRSQHPGHIHFSMRALLQNREGLADLLKQDLYAEPALVPASPWLDSTPPPAPAVRLQHTADQVPELLFAAAAAQQTPQTDTAPVTPESHPAAGAAQPPWLLTVRTLRGTRWSLQIIPGQQSSLRLSQGAVQAIVTAVDRCGNESPAVIVEVN